MRKYYSGKFRPKNIGKYAGDYTNIQYRSHWELQVLKWLDMNASVASYSSEETIIPYRCPTDNRIHRYFVDLKITFANGKTYLVEIKPEAQTREPVRKTKTTKKFLTEVMAYGKNQAKWRSAEAFCNARGWEFEVWTEKFLTESLGLKLVIGSPKRKKPL